MKYYLVETTYVGPNIQDYLNDDLIEIQTVPAYTNMSNEPKIDGWCGTTNDWCVNAYGEYDTLEEAKEAAHKIFGELRETDMDIYSDDFDILAGETVIAYRAGKFPRLTEQETADYYYLTVDDEVKGSMSDEELEQYVENVKQFEAEYGNLEFVPDWVYLREMVEQKRDEKKAEAEE